MQLRPYQEDAVQLYLRFIEMFQARFEFNHKPLDLFTASALPPRDFLVSSHPDSPAKSPGTNRWGC
jgi:hypothetical protein